MNNKLVFISGPYSAATRLQVEYNIGAARDAAIWLVEHKVFYFCPHLNSAFFEHWLPETLVSFYYAMDEEILSRCDALLALPDWSKSKGSNQEVNYCLENKLPVFFWPGEQDKLQEWSRSE